MTLSITVSINTNSDLSRSKVSIGIDNMDIGNMDTMMDCLESAVIEQFRTALELEIGHVVPAEKAKELMRGKS